MRTPFGLVMRLIIGIATVALLGLLYWSSLLQEERLIALQQTVHSLDSKLDKVELLVQEGVSKGLTSTSAHLHVAPTTKRPYMDNNYPNLLSPDPFYAHVLPSLLPSSFAPIGNLREDVFGKPDHFHPFSLWNMVGKVYRMCTAPLATTHLGFYTRVAPCLAEKIELRPDKQGKLNEFWIHLRDQVYWEPLRKEQFPPGFNLDDHFLQRHQVTAEDFAFAIDALFNPYVGLPGALVAAQQLADIEEVRVVDPLTLVVRWKMASIEEDGVVKELLPYRAQFLTFGLTPLPCFVFQYYPDGSKMIEEEYPRCYALDSAWGQQFGEHWAKQVVVSCGPFYFDQMGEKELRLKRNPRFFNPLAVLFSQPYRLMALLLAAA